MMNHKLSLLVLTDFQAKLPLSNGLTGADKSLRVSFWKVMVEAEKISILVVDDQASSMASIIRILSENGFSVDEAKNGEEALSKFKSHHFSIVLTDISMPKGNGIELLKKIKKLNPRCPVFLMSDYPALYAETEGFELADLALKKPLNLEELIQKILMATGHQTSIVSLAA